MKKKTVGNLFVVLIVAASALLVAAKSFGTESARFLDVNENDWFFEDVNYVYKNGLMSGTGEESFSPDDATTRGMIATVLWRMAGSPKGGYMPFLDVRSDAYYNNAVAWCLENKIVSGYSDTVFAPDDFITREQLAAMVYRYANFKGYDIDVTETIEAYSDAEKVSEYAVIPLEWTISKGIISGTSSDTISPQDNAQRCQVAAILKRICDKFSDAEVDEVEEDKKPQSTTNVSGGSSGGSLGGTSGGGPTTTPSVDDAEDTTLETFPIITTASATAKPGDTVQIPIKIKNNPGILGMILSVSFNEEALSVKEIQNGEAFSALDLTPSKKLESGMNLVWDGVEISTDDVKDGDILLINFKIEDNAADGKYPITVKYAEGDILDNDLKPVAPAVKVGYITVTKGGETF